MNGISKAKIIIGIIAVLAALWIIDKIPFSQKIDQTINADIYKDGAVIGETSVYMNGSKTRYIFREDSFAGEFRISSVKQTNIDDLQTEIRWRKDVNFQRISHFYKGDISPSDERGIAYHMLISKDMKDFAILTTEQEIIATSEKAYRLCADHLSYDGDGKMVVSDIDGKLTLK